MGAYLVQHLDPQRLHFAIATALLFLFLLMATPLSKWVHRARLQRARSLRRGAGGVGGQAEARAAAAPAARRLRWAKQDFQRMARR